MASELAERRHEGERHRASMRSLATMPGSEFERMTAYHPFMDRDSLIILGDHVTLDAGSGCVHTATGLRPGRLLRLPAL